MRVLVTGGAGFIGSHIVDDMLRRGHEVLVLDDLSTGRRANVSAEAQLETIDIRDRADVRACFAAFRPDAVSHHAAQASVSASVADPAFDAAVNLIGGLHVLDAARRTESVRSFVFASTGGAIYGHVPEGERAGIDRPRRPASPYAISKAAFEDQLALPHAGSGLKANVLRYANVYGPRQRADGEAGVVAIFLHALRAGRPLHVCGRREAGDAGCVRDYVHVDDVVAAHALALFEPTAPPVLNVGTGVGTTTQDLAKLLADAVGLPAKHTPAPPRAGDVERSVLEPGPQWSPTIDLATGLQRLAAAR